MSKITDEQVAILVKKKKYDEILAILKEPDLCLQDNTRFDLLEVALGCGQEQIVKQMCTVPSLISLEMKNAALRNMGCTRPLNWWGIRFLCLLDAENKPSQEAINETFLQVVKSSCESSRFFAGDVRGETAFERDSNLIRSLCSIGIADEHIIKKALACAEENENSTICRMLSERLFLHSPQSQAKFLNVVLEETKKTEEEVTQQNHLSSELSENTEDSSQNSSKEKCVEAQGVTNQTDKDLSNKGLIEFQNALKVKTCLHFNHETEFDCAVILLKLKRKEDFKGKPEEQDKAFRAAQILCQKLEEEKQHFFYHKNFDLLKGNCLSHIKKGRVVLDKHRDYDKKIMNALAIFLSVGIYGIVILFDRLFKSNATAFFTATDSSLKIDNIEHIFDDKLIKAC